MAESLPPLTADDVEKDLQNPTFSAYIYIGAEADRGWQVAQVAFGLLPRLRIYRAAQPGLVSRWLHDQTNRGIVFGFDAQPKRELSQADTDDVVAVLNAVNDARKTA